MLVDATREGLEVRESDLGAKNDDLLLGGMDDGRGLAPVMTPFVAFKVELRQYLRALPIVVSTATVLVPLIVMMVILIVLMTSTASMGMMMIIVVVMAPAPSSALVMIMFVASHFHFRLRKKPHEEKKT